MAIVLNGNTGIQNVLGSASAPAESNTTSSNTGLYFPSSTTLGLSTNGTNALYIDTSQNIGIGTTSPRTKLDLNNNTISGVGNIGGNANNSAFSIWGGYNITDGGYIQLWGSTSAAPNTLIFGTSSSERMRIDASGNIGIGTASPAYKLDVTGQGRATTGFAVSADGSTFTPAGLNAIPNYGVGYITSTSQTALSGFGGIPFYTNQAERMRIDSSGNVGIGTGSITQLFANYTQLGIKGGSTVAGGTLQFLNSAGTITTNLVSDTNGTYLGAVGGTYIVFSVGGSGTGTERMRLDSNGNLLVGTTTAVGKLTVNGAVSVNGGNGTYSFDASSNQANLANGGTIDFANFSGILIINNTSNGSVYIYACGGGATGSIGGIGTFQGTVTYVAGIGGYRYTNNTGGTIGIGITAFRTRVTA